MDEINSLKLLIKQYKEENAQLIEENNELRQQVLSNVGNIERAEEIYTQCKASMDTYNDLIKSLNELKEKYNSDIEELNQVRNQYNEKLKELKLIVDESK